jgi:hypothetical protein
MVNSYVQFILIRTKQIVFLKERWGNDENKTFHWIKYIDLYSTIIPIAQQLYVGLYCSDCACQTEQDEIIQLKNTTKLLKNLYHV